MYNLIERSKKLRKNGKKGFTLIELIVVIVIIGILAAIIIPRLSGFQMTARFNSDLASAKTIATAASTYYTENEDVDAANVGDLVTDGYLTDTPMDSFGGAFTMVSTDGDIVVTNSKGDDMFPAPARADVLGTYPQ